jgi:AraC-like DNA-binding protein
VRLHPACAPALLTLSAAALRDAGAPAGEILGDEGKRLEDELAEAGEASARRSVLLSWLRQRARVARPPDPLARMVARGLSADPATRVAVLARHLGVTERRLHRHVVAEIGYGPKRLGRVLRLRRALAEVRAGADLAEAAFAAGYFDQSHFTGDCGELAGAPPTVVVGH